MPIDNGNLDTTAGRLAVVLKRFHKQPADRRAHDAWANAVEAADKSELFQRLAMLHYLFQTTKEQLLLLPEAEHPDHLLGAIKPLNSLPARWVSNMSTQKKNWDDIINDATIQAVEFCALALKRAGLATEVESVEERNLEELLHEVQDWMNYLIKEPELSPKAKYYLIQRLREIEIALQTFFIGGGERLEDAVAALGRTILSQPETNSSSASTKERFKRLYQLVLHLVTGTRQISGAVVEGTEAIEAINSHL